MNERENDMAINKQPNRKENKQVSFRVNADEYAKLKQSAETLNMSVAQFAKKKAQNARLVKPKFDTETKKQIVRELSQLGNNVNQIARVVNKNNETAQTDDFERNLAVIRERLDEIWQQLS